MNQSFERLCRALYPKQKRDGARRGPWRSEAKRRFIASLPCMITGKSGVQCCHVTHNGMASKGTDALCIPLVPALHDQLDGRAKLPNGKVGKVEFQRYYLVDVLEAARDYHRMWELQGEEPGCSCDVSGDQADATRCELHNPSSIWNRRRVKRPLFEHARADEQDFCPF